MPKVYASIDIDGTTNTVATNYTVYTVPVNNDALVDIFLTNRHATVGSDLNVAVVPSGASINDSHYLQHSKTLAAKSASKIENVHLSEGDAIVFNASADTVNMVVLGTYLPE